MPMGQREQPLRSGGGDGSDSGKAGLRGGGVFTEVPMQLYEAGGIGGDGGVGGGLKFLKPLLSIDDALKVAFPDMTAVEFCEQHDLGDEVRQFLEEQGFDPVDALLYADEVDMMDEGFQVGQIAEVKWALKKILLETFDTLVAAKIKGTNKPDISGGTGGVGGYGGQAGGGGGFGAPPRFPVEEAYRFGRISGGIGGEGGASRSPRGPNENQQSPSRKTETVTDVAQFPPLFGGTGGRGGWGDVVGGVGGYGEASQLAIEDVGFFMSIAGGEGGGGGASERRGGSGGTGHGSRFPVPLFPIDDETRRRMPFTKLEHSNIKPELCQLLRNRGFRTVGGVFEAYDLDVGPPHFKPGHASVLKGALRKFVAKNNQSGGSEVVITRKVQV